MKTRRYFKFLAGIGTSLILLFLLVNSTDAAAGKASIAPVTNAGVLGEDRFTVNNINTINNREGTITNLATSTLNTDLNWSIQAVDGGHVPYSPSLKLDSTGTPHMALGGVHLYYATLNAGNWDIETVDNSNGAGSFFSLVIDSNDHPHMAYLAGNDGTMIRYAYWDGSQWILQEITGISGNSGWTSIALDSSDRPEIVYSDYALGLRYAYWTGTSWSIQTVDTCTQTVYPSIVVDSTDIPHISYNCKGLRYATWTGTSWHIDILDTNNVGQGATSIALDSNGYPHIAYYEGAAYTELRYISWNGSSWDSPGVVDANASRYFVDVSLVIDSLDQSHICYIGNNHDLREAKLIGSTWIIQTVPNATNVGSTTSQELDSSGNAHVGYAAFSPSRFFYTYETSPGTWTIPQLVDQSSSDGDHTSIAIDQNNHPHISSLDINQNTLRYSTWDGTQWIHQVVDKVVANDYHVYSSIQTDTINRPHIAYFGIGGLKYASWDGSQWQIQSLGVYGRYASLALDKTTGYPRIAFCSSGLKYASWDGSVWNIQTVDSSCGGGDFGGEDSLVLDTNGNPHIAYNLNSSSLLLYAFWDSVNSQWVKQVVTSFGTYGKSLALDSSGIPHIAFCGPNPAQHRTVQYASWNGSSWDLTTIDDPYPTYVGQCSMISLAMDGNDTPHIAYPNWKDDSIYYITWNGTAWTSQVVDTDIGWSGLDYTPIAVGPNNEPWIAYGNWWSRSLMVAHGIPPYRLYLPLVIR